MSSICCSVSKPKDVPEKKGTWCKKLLLLPCTIDDSTIGVRHAAVDFIESITRRDRDGIISGCTNLPRQVNSVVLSCLSGLRKTTTVAKLIVQHSSLLSHLFSYANILIHTSNSYLDSTLSNDIRFLIPKYAITGLTFLVDMMGVVFYLGSLSRDKKALKALQAPTVREKINQLQKCDSMYFRLSLPLDVRQEIRKHSVNEYKDQTFFVNLRAEDETRSNNFLKRIEKCVTRRIICQKASVIASLAAVGSVLLSLFPKTAPIGTLFSAFNSVLFLVILCSKGWVENPKPGYNPKLFLPECCQKKAPAKPVIPIQQVNVTEMTSLLPEEV